MPLPIPRAAMVENEILPGDLFPCSENINYNHHTVIELKLTADLLVNYVFFTPTLPADAWEDIKYENYEPRQLQDAITGKNNLTITHIPTNQKKLDVRLSEELIKIVSLSEHHFATVSTTTIKVRSTTTFETVFQYEFTTQSNQVLLNILSQLHYPNKVLTVGLLQHIQKFQQQCLNQINILPEVLSNLVNEYNPISNVISGELLQEGRFILSIYKKIAAEFSDYPLAHSAEIVLAAKAGDWQRVIAGLDEGIFQINYSFDSYFDFGKTILWHAARAQQWDIVTRICQEYADEVYVDATFSNPYKLYFTEDYINANDVNRTALWFALHYKHLPVANLLVSKNAKLSDEMQIAYKELQLTDSVVRFFSTKRLPQKAAERVCGYLEAAEVNKLKARL